MAVPRGKKTRVWTRRAWLLGGGAAPFSRLWGIPSLNVQWDGDNLHFTAPQLHFLAGKPLDRLKDGASVAFASQLSLTLESSSSPLRRVLDRFILSYDLWEEKFSVAKMGATRRTASRMSAEQVEGWCLESLALETSGVPADRRFWVRFDLRLEDGRGGAGVVGDQGISLTRLIELFGRPASSQQPHWLLEAGPLRLAGLVRVRGTRSE